MNNETRFDRIEDGIKATARGEMVICVDDEAREHEGDLICAAEKITPEMIDQKLVDSQVIQQLIDQLQLEGLNGQISSVKGLDLADDTLISNNSFKIRNTKTF